MQDSRITALEHMNSLVTCCEEHWRVLLPPVPRLYPDLSSLGIAEEYMSHIYGDFEIEHFDPLMVVNTLQPWMFLWTFKGQLHLNINYNSQYQTHEDMQALLEATTKQLHQGLNVDVAPPCL
jgi:hypothetical protein